MKNNNKVLEPTKKSNEDIICQNCQIIRIFLLSVVFVIILALIQSDKLHYLSFVTPLNGAILVITLGLIMFFIKLAKYYINKKHD